MYGKFFASTFTGSMIGAGSDVFAVWGYVIANARDASVELNPTLLSATLGTPKENVMNAIQYLCSPDPDSRNPEEEGRRLIKTGSFSYRVVTHAHYQRIRSEEERRAYNRQKMRESRARRKGKNCSYNSRENDPDSANENSRRKTEIQPKSSGDAQKNGYQKGLIFYLKGESGNIKIGFSEGNFLEKGQLIDGNFLLAVEDGTANDFENREFQFKTDRLKAHWFRPSRALSELIEELREKNLVKTNLIDSDSRSSMCAKSREQTYSQTSSPSSPSTRVEPAMQPKPWVNPSYHLNFAPTVQEKEDLVSLSCRMPISMRNLLRKIAGEYRTNMTAVVVEILEKGLPTIPPRKRE